MKNEENQHSQSAPPSKEEQEKLMLDKLMRARKLKSEAFKRENKPASRPDNRRDTASYTWKPFGVV